MCALLYNSESVSMSEYSGRERVVWNVSDMHINGECRQPGCVRMEMEVLRMHWGWVNGNVGDCDMCGYPVTIMLNRWMPAMRNAFWHNAFAMAFAECPSQHTSICAHTNRATVGHANAFALVRKWHRVTHLANVSARRRNTLLIWFGNSGRMQFGCSPAAPHVAGTNAWTIIDG